MSFGKLLTDCILNFLNINNEPLFEIKSQNDHDEKSVNKFFKDRQMDLIDYLHHHTEMEKREIISKVIYLNNQIRLKKFISRDELQLYFNIVNNMYMNKYL